MKKTLKRCFSAILAVAVILVGMPIILPAQAESYDTTYTNEYYYPSGTAFISSFSVAASGSSDTAWNSIGNAGYTHLGIDLNKKAEGDYIYSGYKTSTDPKNAIRALACWNGANPPTSFTHASGAVYYAVKSPSGEIIDLNKGAGGDYIYFYYTTDDEAGPPMIALDWEEDSHINDSGNQCQTPVVWLNSNKGGVQGNPASLNQNAGGRQIHFFYNTTGTKVDTKDLRDSMKNAKPFLDKSSQYTSASFSALKTAYNNAENITNDYNPDGLSSSYPQSTIDSYKTALNNAIAGLQTTVYLNGNGGTISPSSVVVTIGAASSVAFDCSSFVPSRTGYIFQGWASSDSATTGSKTSITVYFNTTIYAVWTPISYTIKYHANGGSGTMEDTAMTYGTAKNLTNNTFTRGGHYFAGWNTQAEGNGTTYQNEQSVNNLTTTDNDEITLYAQWKAYPKVMFANEFDFTEKFKNPTDGVTVNHDANSITMTAPANSEKHTGFLLPIKLIPGHSYGISLDFSVANNNSTATEKAQAQALICFTPNGTPEELREASKNANYGNPDFYVDANSPSIADGGSTTMNGTFTVPNGKQYVHLRFDVNNADATTPATGTIRNIYIYDITFTDGDNEQVVDTSYTGPVPIQIVGEPNGTVNVNNLQNPPHRDGYAFGGWSHSKTSDGNGDVNNKVSADGNVTLPPTGNVVLYPIWIAKTYTVKYNANGGSGGPMQDTEMTYGVSQNLSKNVFTKTGYFFKGWTLAADGSGTLYKDEQPVKNLPTTDDEITLYAQWELCPKVIFTNEFDFDVMLQKQTNDDGEVVDFVNKTLKMTELADDNNEHSSVTLGDMKLVPGHTYRVTYDFNVTVGSAKGQYHIWFGKSLDDHDYIHTNQSPEIYHHGRYGEDEERLSDGTGDSFFTVPADRPYAKIRFDVDNNIEGTTKPATATYSNIYIYDVTFTDSDGELVADESYTGPHPVHIVGQPNTTVNVNTVQNPHRDGYTFGGWSEGKKDDGNGDINKKIPDGNVTLPEKGNKVLYPIWTAETYTIKFDANGGTGEGIDPITATYGEKILLPQNTFAKEHYEFVGWNTQADGRGTGFTDRATVKNLTAENEITLYAQWDINEVLFGNMFDFDKYTWDEWYNCKKELCFADRMLHSVIVVADSDAADGKIDNYLDAYTNDYNSENQNGSMELIPGRTYEFSCKVENLSAYEINASMFMFAFTDTTLKDEIHNEDFGINFVSREVTVEKDEKEAEISGKFTMPAGRSYATFRVGTHTPDAKVKFYEICVRDITNFADTPVKDDVTKANPLSKSADENRKVTGFPELTRTGYTFVGWSTELKENGNGNIEHLKTEWIFTGTASENKILYPIWVPNVVVVKMKLGLSAAEDITQNFYFGEAQKLTAVPETPSFTVEFYDGSEVLIEKTVDVDFVHWSASENDAEPFYNNAQLLTNPGGAGIYTSNIEGKNTFNLYAKWANVDGNSIEAPFVTKNDYVLVGWSLTENSKTADYKAEQEIIPEGDMSLYAVWKSVPEVDKIISDYQNAYSGKQEVVSGIEIGADGVENAAEIKESSAKFNTSEFDTAKSEYDAAKNTFARNKNAETNNALLGAIGNVESSAAKAPAEEAVIDYLKEFEIKYAAGVEGAVPAGKYSVADMNLNHYTTGVLDEVSGEWSTAENYSKTTSQNTINESVVKLAKAFANPQKVESTPTYNVYDADTSLPADLAARVDESKGETAGVSYVYTGKGNYTYYCYTNSKKPKLYITVDEATGGENRVCYPTTAVLGDTVFANGATQSEMPKRFTTQADNPYVNYTNVGMGTKLGTDYYSEKAVIEVAPDFTNASDKATATYTFKAYDDAYVARNASPNYADSAKLASGATTGNLADIPNTNNAVTPENTITIIIDYHPGDTMNVKGKQVGHDQWLKQYHLERTSGGASNWELPMPGDGVYTVNDSTYGQKDYGSFTYTFEFGASNDFANCVLSSKDVNDVIATVKEHYDEMKSVPFTGANTATGTGLGHQVWSNTGWSYNYYPKSNAYTYVHIVDRWGNTFDDVIPVPNLDYLQSQINGTNAGQAMVIEDGGSGIDTMSFSAQSFEIITDENSIFDGETYTTSGNTIKVYTGEANKKYTLAANDVATNKTTANVTTDAEGYLTITVEDKAFNNDGMYTFSLNGKQINLYGEIETEPEEPTRGVTNVEYTPSTSTRNEFKFTVLGRPDKIQVIEPDGGTRTYDRYHTKVEIASYDDKGNEVGAMSRELSYEVWKIEMNVPADIELTAIARYGREWTKDAPYKYTVILATPEFDDEVYSMSLAAKEGKQGKVAATVVTGLDVQGVRFVMDNNTTATYYKSTEADGKLTYNGYAWMNHEGENIIIVKIRVNNAWLNAGELNYNAS